MLSRIFKLARSWSSSGSRQSLGVVGAALAAIAAAVMGASGVSAPGVLLVLLALGLAGVSFVSSRPRRRRRAPSTTQAGRRSRAPATPGAGLSAGAVIGQYQLLTCVGRGWMGHVWAARRIGAPLQRLVAIRTGIGAGKEDPEFRRLFTDASRVASLIRHPNVCGMYEFGKHEGVLYQVMEWCDGASLRQVLGRLSEGRLERPVAARIIANASAGLHAAHRLEDDDGQPLHVVHRDVSPQNILISSRGLVQVTDFGVERVHRRRRAAGVAPAAAAAYAAPEQIESDAVDHRTDIFALGCILYEATVGRGPFDIEPGTSTLRRSSWEVAPPKSFVPDYPEALAAIVLRALAQDPSQRQQSAEELAVALETWLARSYGIVTEQTIAELVRRSADDFIKDKAARIDQASARLGVPSPLGYGALLSSNAPSIGPALSLSQPRPPPEPAIALRLSQPRPPPEPAQVEAATRPTIPAGRRRS